jgi:hypothetical protein
VGRVHAADAADKRERARGAPPPSRPGRRQAPGRGSPGMAGPRAAAAPRAAAVDAQRRLVHARQRVVWAALRHGAVAPSAAWAARCALLLEPLLPHLNARVAAALLRAVSGAGVGAAEGAGGLDPRALAALVDRAVVCCTMTRGPLLLDLLQGLAAVMGGGRQQQADAVVLTPRQRRLATLSVLRSCADLSPQQQARALALLRRAGAAPATADGGRAWFSWVCQATHGAMQGLPPKDVAALVGLLTTAAYCGVAPGNAAAAAGPARARALVPALRSALLQLSAAGEEEVAAGLGSQRLSALLVATALLHRRTQALQGRPSSLAAEGQRALAAAALGRMHQQLASEAAQATSSRVVGPRWGRARTGAAVRPGTPLLPGAMALQLAAALPAVPARPSRTLAAALSRQLAGLAACGVAEPRAVRGIWGRVLAGRLRVAATAAARLAASGAAAAAEAAETAHLAAEQRAAADAAAAAARRGSVRRLRVGSGAAARRATLLRQLAELSGAGDGRGADGSLLVPQHPLLVGAGNSNSNSSSELESSLALQLPMPVALPVLSSLLEIRFARLVTHVVLPAVASGRGEGVVEAEPGRQLAAGGKRLATR